MKKLLTISSVCLALFMASCKSADITGPAYEAAGTYTGVFVTPSGSVSGTATITASLIDEATINWSYGNFTGTVMGIQVSGSGSNYTLSSSSLNGGVNGNALGFTYTSQGNSLSFSGTK